MAVYNMAHKSVTQIQIQKGKWFFFIYSKKIWFKQSNIYKYQPIVCFTSFSYTNSLQFFSRVIFFSSYYYNYLRSFSKMEEYKVVDILSNIISTILPWKGLVDNQVKEHEVESQKRVLFRGFLCLVIFKKMSFRSVGSPSY